MSILKTVEPAKAEGKLKELYGAVEKVFGTIPNSVKLLGVNDATLESQLNMLSYYSQHEKISSKVFALIRVLVAKSRGNQYCTRFNTGLLVNEGFDLKTVVSMSKDNMPDEFTSEEKLLVNYVMRALDTPEETGEKDIAKLKEAGWRELDIFDALEHGSRMVYVGHIFRALKIEMDI